MSKKYYVYFGKTKVGTFSGSLLVTLAKHRAISRDTIIEQVDTGKQMRAGELKTLPFPPPKKKYKEWPLQGFEIYIVIILLSLLSASLGALLAMLLK